MQKDSMKTLWSHNLTVIYHCECRSHNLNKWDLYEDLYYIIDYARNNAVPDEVRINYWQIFETNNLNAKTGYAIPQQ